MPKIPLVGQFYQARSLAAGAQNCTNLFAELIQDPNERAKNVAFLVGCPGRHLAKDLTAIDAAATPIRGIFNFAGRLFVAAGTKYMELDSGYNLVGSVRTIYDDASHNPVQMFVNGTQLFVVSTPFAYIDNGAGPVQITTATLTGTVDTTIEDGIYYLVVWESGDEFSPSITTITINAVVYTVAQFISGNQLLLTTSAGVQSGVAYSAAPVFTALTGAFLDGYFIANRPNTRQVYISALNDGTQWSALDFGVKESYPDYVRSILAVNEQLYVFGTDTYEVWQNTGAADFPLQRIDGASHKFGSISAWGPINIDDRVFFLGGNQQGWIVAYVMDGFTPKRISTHAEEHAWNNGTQPTNVVSYTYLEEGHTFWIFQLGATGCWGYDTTTGAWHQRASWTGSAFSDYPTYYHAFISTFGGGKHIIGGRNNGTIYESSVNFYDDVGNAMCYQRSLPYIFNDGNLIYFGRLQLEMDTGTPESGQTLSVTLSYSDDRGHTFKTEETVDILSTPNWDQRVYWPPQGSSYGRVPRFTLVGTAKVCLVECDWEYSLGEV